MLGSTMRYLCDLTPCLMILAVIGYWQAGRLFRRRATPARYGPGPLFHFLTGSMVAWSIVIGVLLGVSGYYEHFRVFHNHLFGSHSYWAQEDGVTGSP